MIDCKHDSQWFVKNLIYDTLEYVSKCFHFYLYFSVPYPLMTFIFLCISV